MRAALRVGLVLAVAASLLLGAAAAVLTGRAPETARRLLEWSASRALGARVRIERVEGALVRSARIVGVSIDAPDGEPLRIRSVTFEPDRLSWREGRLGLRAVAIEGVQVRLQAGDGNALSLWGWRAEGGGPGAAPMLAVSLERLVLREVGVVLRSSLATLRGQVDGEVDDLHWPPGPEHPWPRSSEIRLRLEGRSGQRDLSLSELVVAQRGSGLRLEARGVEGAGLAMEGDAEAALVGTWLAPGFETAAGSLRYAQLDLALLLERDDLRSSLNGSARWSWDGRELRARAELEASRLAERGLTGSAEGWWRPRAGGFEFALDRISLDSDFATAEVAIRGDEKAASRLRVSRADIDLAAIPPDWLAAPDLAGRVALAADLSGPWREPRGPWSVRLEGAAISGQPPLSGRIEGTAEADGGLRVAALNVSWARPGAPVAIAAQAPFELRPRAGGVEVSAAKLSTLGGVIGVSGGITAQGLHALGIEVRGVDAGSFGSPQRELRLGGRLDGGFTLDGPLPSPGVEGTLEWSDPALGELAAERVHLSLTPREDRIALEGTLTAQGRTALRLEASALRRDLDWRSFAALGDARLSANLALDGLAAAWLAPLLPQAMNPVGGRLDGELLLVGSAQVPEIGGRIRWSEPRLGRLEADQLELNVESAAPGDPLRASALLTLKGREALAAELSLPSRERLYAAPEPWRDPASSLDLRLDGFELEWLAPFEDVRALRAAGRLDGQVRLRGGVPTPTAEGAVRIAELRVSGPPLSGQLGPANGSLTVAGRTLRLEELVLPSSEGEARLSGSLSWDADAAAPDTELTLALRRFAIDQPGVVAGLLDGDLRVKGRPEALRAQGALTLLEAGVELPEREDPLSREIEIVGLPEAEPPESSIFAGEGGALAGLEADLTLVVGDEVWLRGFGADLEIEGELHLDKPRDGDPGLLGSVRVIGGRVEVHGKRLRVVEGSASFDGRTDPDPYLDATAEHRVRDVIILVRLFGPASDLKIELDSEPPMTPEEQLAYLLFDRSLDELGENEQGSVAAASAVGTLGAAALPGGRITGDLAEAVGLDAINLGIEGKSPTLEIEKRVHDRLVVRYGRSFASAEGGDRFSAEWRLFRRLFAAGETSTDGSSGLYLFWRHDY